MVLAEQLAVDGHSLLALAHDTIDEGHEALVVLVAWLTANGLGEQRHYHKRIVGGGLAAHLLERLGEQPLGHGGQRELAFVLRFPFLGRGHDAAPVGLDEVLHTHFAHELQRAESGCLLTEPQGVAHDGIVGAPVLIVDVGQHTQQSLEDAHCLGRALLFQPLFQDVAGRPEHGQRGVFALVRGIHGAYGLVSLLHTSLLAQLKDFLDSHLKVF